MHGKLYRNNYSTLSVPCLRFQACHQCLVSEISPLSALFAFMETAMLMFGQKKEHPIIELGEH